MWEGDAIIAPAAVAISEALLKPDTKIGFNPYHHRNRRKHHFGFLENISIWNYQPRYPLKEKNKIE